MDSNSKQSPAVTTAGLAGDAGSVTPIVDDCAKAVIFVAKRWREGNLTDYQFVCRIEALMDGPRKMERELSSPNGADQPRPTNAKPL